MAKAYTPLTWVDEVLTGDERYDILDDLGAPIEVDVQIDLVTTVAQAGTAVDAGAMNNIEDAIDAIDTLLRTAATEKTVSGGVLTVDLARHKVQPQSATADDIDTISGIEADTLVILFASDPGTDTLTFKHGTGNLSCFGGSDIALSEGFVVGYYDGTTVYLAGGDMATAIYDPAGIAEQLIGLTATQTLTNKRITRRVTSEASSATPTINSDNTDLHRITALATSITSMTTNLSGTPMHGQGLVVEITDDSTPRTIAWGASFASTTATLPTTTVASAILRIGLLWNSATSKWDCVAVA